MKNYVFLLLAITIVFVACDNNDTVKPINENELLIGFWGNQQYHNNIINFDRINAMLDNDYSLHFNYDNEFIERKYPAWSSTHPSFFEDFEGSWQQSDDLLTIQVGDWGGEIEYVWKVVQLTKHKLAVEVISIKDISTNN